MPVKRKTVKRKKPVKRAVKKPIKKTRKKVKKKVDKTIIFMKGENTVKKRRKRRKPAVKRVYKRRVYKKRATPKRRYYGASRTVNNGITGLIMQGLSVTGGAVGGSMLARFIPIKNVKIKSFIPIALGAGLISTKMGRKGMVKDAALGSVAIGLISLLKTFVPTVPLLAADAEELALLGMADDLLEDENAMLGLPIGEDYDDYDGEDYDGEDYDDYDGESDDDLEDAEFMGIPINGEGASPADF